MLQDYIGRRLRAKNRGIYFKKGKWVFHALWVLIFWLVTYQKLIRDAGLQKLPGLQRGTAALVALISISPFLLFFYFHCLYLIPECFKRRRYKRFWIFLIALLLVMPWVEEGLQAVLRVFGMPPQGLSSKSGWAYVRSAYLEFVSAFLGFTTILFLMELMEGVRTLKETGTNSDELAHAEVQLLKTRMNPDFVNRSLDDIIALAEAGSEQAPDAVVQFSDVLRYRLYRSNRGLVRLNEELQQLGNLFRLQHTMPQGLAALEVEGENEAAFLTPMLLLNIAEHLLATYREGEEWSLLLYILVEAAELQIAIELGSSNQALIGERLDTIRVETERICGARLNFATEQNNNNYSIRICLPIQQRSTVSS